MLISRFREEIVTMAVTVRIETHSNDETVICVMRRYIVVLIG
jgi:hypothetical protein